MKKLLFSLVALMSMFFVSAQNVTLEVNVGQVSDVQISGYAMLDIVTPGQLDGSEIAVSTPVYGEAYSSTGMTELMVESFGFGFPELDQGIDIVVNGMPTPIMYTIGVPTPVSPMMMPGLNPIDVVFQTNGMPFYGVPSGLYLTDFIFSTYDF